MYAGGLFLSFLVAAKLPNETSPPRPFYLKTAGHSELFVLGGCDNTRDKRTRQITFSCKRRRLALPLTSRR